MSAEQRTTRADLPDCPRCKAAAMPDILTIAPILHRRSESRMNVPSAVTSPASCCSLSIRNTIEIVHVDAWGCPLSAIGGRLFHIVATIGAVGWF